MFAIFSILLIGLANAAFIDDIQPIQRVDKPYIVGGEECEIDEVPYQVVLNRYGSHYCGGVIISQFWVLTAAHCVYNAAPESITIRVGNKDKTAGTLYQIVQVVVHPNYSSSKYSYDCAVIRTIVAIDFSKNVQRAMLPEANYTCPPGSLALTSGWGATSSGGSATKYVQKVEVPITTKTYCDRAYPGLVDDTMTCAGFEDGKHDSCQGDSGGPLKQLSSNILCGVVSWGKGCAMPNYPGVYCNVGHVDIRSWIARICGV